MSFKLIVVLAWFPMTSSWNPACYIWGLTHGTGRGVSNDSYVCLSSNIPTPFRGYLLRRHALSYSLTKLCKVKKLRQSWLCVLLENFPRSQYLLSTYNNSINCFRLEFAIRTQQYSCIWYRAMLYGPSFIIWVHLFTSFNCEFYIHF